MSTQKRQRKREGRQVRQTALAARQRKARRRRALVAGGLVGLLILGIAAVVSGGGDSGEEASKTTTTGANPPAGQTVTGPTNCPAADGSSPRTTGFAQPPPMCIDPAKAYVADIKTDKGDMTVALAASAAPQTVNNFVVLSRYHYFDGVRFHRIIPGFVVQGGDPKGDGTGGPGYTIPDELPQAGQYKPGSLAMANTGQPGSGGSQFFIITGPQGEALPPQYSLFGQVIQGMDVAKAIEATGSGDGTPTETVKIKSVTIREP